MSFARFGAGSDLYVFASVSGGVECCGCLLPVGVYEQDEVYESRFIGRVEHKRGDPRFESRQFFDLESLLQHYRDHQAVGHAVPKSLFDTEQYEPDDFK